MKILIFGDIHGRRFWKEPFEKYIDDVHKVVFVGDYMDQYQNEGIMYDDAINNFNEIIEAKRKYPDKVVLLLGNHDFHYRNKQFQRIAKSTRFNDFHSDSLYDIFNGDNKDLFKLCHIENVGNKKVIFTHAGITRFWIKYCDYDINDVDLEEKLNSLENTPDGIELLGCIGKYRTWIGMPTGSLLWCDIREFVGDEKYGGKNMDGVFQVFGHTMLKEGKPIIEDGFAEIDCQRAFIMDDDLKLEMV